jgi:hypothetical protein
MSVWREKVKVKEHVLKTFNTAMLKDLTPFRAVIDGAVLAPQVAFSCCQKIFSPEENDEESTEEGQNPESSEQVNESSNEQQRIEKENKSGVRPQKSVLENILQPNHVLAHLPDFMHRTPSQSTTEESFEC